MVNPAFSESQLKNLRRQNRHLASTHRRKLVFLQASRNPAHGSGRPFFVRDVPVPASFCPAFAPPAPVSAAPQLRPFCRPHRFCPRLPASPARRTELVFVLCALPFRFPARHPGNGPVPASFWPAPVASAFAPPAPVSAAPQLRPFRRPHRFCLRLPASPARRTKFGSVLCTLPFRIPARHPGNGPVRHLSVRPLSLRPSPLRLPFPPLPSSDRSTVLAAPYLRLPAAPVHRTKYGSVLCTLPFRIPTRHAGNGPSGIFLSGLRPYGSRPLPLPSSGRSAVPSASALVFQPLPHAGQSSDSFCARCRSASPPGTPGTVPSQHLSIRPSPLRLPFPQLPSSDRSAVLTASALVFQPLPHAGQSSGPYCARCRSASPPGTPGTVPSDIFLPGLRPSGSRFRRSAVFALSRRGSAPPRGDRPNRLLLRPGTRKGLSDRSQTAPFLSVCYSGTSPNTQFSENWKNSSDGPLHSYSRSRTSPPPSEHAAQRIEKLAGQLRPLPNRAAGRPPSRPGSGGAQQFIAPQQWIT